MSYFPRQVDVRLLEWAKSKSRKPIMLRGARQVGKTALVRHLAQSAQLKLCELNFERNPRLRTLFTEAGDLSPASLIPLCEALLGIEICPGQTLLFLDEIQECPQAIVALRYFFEECPDLHVIAAGSLLDFALSRVSVPVGRVSFVFVRPMSFDEFLIATGRISLHKQRPKWSHEGSVYTVPTAIHDALRDALREYLIVGGMPACVVEFNASKSFARVREVQSDIVHAYLADVRKYAKGDAQVSNVGEVMANAFSFVGKQISYTALGHGDAIKRTKQSVHLLAQAQIIHVVRATSAVSKPPLSAEASDKTFKIIFLDIGLGQYLAGVKISDLVSAKDLITTYEGKLTEQFVGQELLATTSEASEGGNLYFWERHERGSTAEVDYLLSREGIVHPVEVKSGPSGRLRSLHLFLKAYSGKGECLQDTQHCSIHGDLHFWPLYTILS